MTKSEDMLKHLKAHPALIAQNVAKFREELRDLNSKSPTILAFGTDAYKIIHQNIGKGNIQD